MMGKRDRFMRRYNHTFDKDMEYLYRKRRYKLRNSKKVVEYYTRYFNRHKSNMKRI